MDPAPESLNLNKNSLKSKIKRVGYCAKWKIRSFFSNLVNISKDISTYSFGKSKEEEEVKIDEKNGKEMKEKGEKREGDKNKEIESNVKDVKIKLEQTTSESGGGLKESVVDLESDVKDVKVRLEQTTNDESDSGLAKGSVGVGGTSDVSKRHFYV